MLKIVQAPDPVLAANAKPVERIDENIRMLISEMIKTLEAAHDPEGVGLAAPQVGRSLRLFIIKQTPESPVTVYINPVIEKITPVKKLSKRKNKEKNVKLEGCLSLQDIWGVVRRSSTVTLSYQDEHGMSHTKKFTGFPAIIIQHEFDHINGILFPKRVLEQQEKLYKTKKDKNGEIVFEEIKI
jgi:peptide deformylase